MTEVAQGKEIREKEEERPVSRADITVFLVVTPVMTLSGETVSWCSWMTRDAWPLTEHV